MTSNLLKAIGEILSGLHCDYRFEYDEAAAMNIKADAIKNNKGLIFMEEVRRGRYDMNGGKSRFYKTKDTAISINFCRFSPELNEFASDNLATVNERNNLTLTRQTIRDRIECEVIMPFIETLENYVKGPHNSITVSSLEYVYPTHSRFDSNEVCITLNFTITQYNSCWGNL